MSLTYDLTRIPDYENVCYIEQEIPADQGGGKKTIMNPVTNAIIHATMAVGIGGINNARIAEEFYARLAIYERASGSMLIVNGEPSYITPAEVKQHIGLTTNVPNEPRTKWIKRIITDDRTGLLTQFIRNFRSETRERTAN